MYISLSKGTGGLDKDKDMRGLGFKHVCNYAQCLICGGVGESNPSGLVNPLMF